MEDIERYLGALTRSAALVKKLSDTLEEDRENIRKGLSGEAEEVYKKQCEKAIEKTKKMQKAIRILYSESSAGLI
jgi:hypothetical protein